jgi:hypothetical protein
MADPGHFWIGLCLVCDKATVTSSINFHCGVSRQACEPKQAYTLASLARPTNVYLVPIVDDAWFEMKEAAN